MKLLRWSSPWRSHQGLTVAVKNRPAMDFTEEEKAAICQLRQRVGHRLPPQMNTDLEISKWLIARQYNMEKAEDMLLKHLEWRKVWDLDSIRSWKPPEVLLKYYPIGLCGFDYEGCPMWVIPYGKCDIRGLLQSCTTEEYIRYTFQILEGAIEDMRLKYKDRRVKQSCIFDMEDFSMRHVTCKQAMDMVLQLVPMYEGNFPEHLKCAFVINAPRIFSLALAIVRPFVDDVTFSKIHIYGKTGWKEALLELMPADQLPAYWGGTQTDPDGNPKCLSKICYGGEVPKKYYLKKKDPDEEIRRIKSHLKTLVLPNGGKETLSMEVDHPGTELRWEFQSEDFDVGFGISRLLSSGKVDEIFPLQRVNSQLTSEEGSLICCDPGTYQVTFDNEYSYLRSKTIYYDLQVFPPSEHTKL